MPTNDINSQRIENEVRELQDDMISVKHILSSQESILREIKDALVMQAKTLEEVTRVRDRLQVLDEDIMRVDRKFEERKRLTDEKIIQGESFKGQIKGALSVFVIVISFVQGMIAWYVSGTDTKIEKISDKVIIIEQRQHSTAQKIENLREKITELK